MARRNNQYPQSYLPAPYNIAPTYFMNRAPTSTDTHDGWRRYQVPSLWIYNQDDADDNEIWACVYNIGEVARWIMLGDGLGGDLHITEYIVDVLGQDGSSFTTIQSAIDQAVSDGAGGGIQKVIYIRSGVYVEDLTIYPGLIFVGDAPKPVGGASGVVIQGAHQVEDNTSVECKDIYFLATSGNDLFTNNGSLESFSFFNCYISMALSSGSVCTARAGVSIENCYFVSFNSPIPAELFGAGTTNVDIRYSDFGAGEYLTCSTINAYSSRIGACEVTSNSRFEYCRIEGSGGKSAITSSAPLTIINTRINSSGVNPVIDASGENLFINGISVPADTTQLSNGVERYGKVVQNSYIPRLTKSANYQLLDTDYYVGVTDTSSPRTITLPDTFGSGNDSCKDRVFIIKDESGNAGTNNITIAPHFGSETIDGGASIVLASDYASVTLIYDGSNYFTI